MKFLSTLVASALGTMIALGIVFFIGLTFLLVFMAAADRTPSVSPGSVLVLELTGPIPEVVSGDPINQALASEPPFDLRDLVAALRMAREDDRIDALWIQVRSMSGSWAALEELRTAVLQFKESGKPVFASSDDYAMTENAYFVACAADSVFAAKQGIFEFNGFNVTVAFFHNLMEMLDVEPQVVRAGRFKSAVEPFTREDLSPENEEQLSAYVQLLDDVFMEAVGESRGMSSDSLRRIASERAIISADDAFAEGLLDGLLFRDEVIDVIKLRLGVDPDEDLREIHMKSYYRVPPSDAGLDVNRDGDIAIVYAVGQIVSGESDMSDPFGGNFVGAETFISAMEEARESDRIEAVVVRIDSPGGSASASDVMWRAIRRTAAEKPVVVSMGGLAASGGYWIATGAPMIVADPLTVTGSIGVFGMFVDASGMFENKFGITFDGVQTSPYADVFSGISPLSDDERRMLEAFIDGTYDEFLQRVADARSMSTTQVDSIAQGRIWMGRHAQELGLVDSLATLSEAVAIAAEEAGLGEGPYRVRVLPRPKSFLEQLTSGLSARAARAWIRASTTPAERALLEQAKQVRAVLEYHGTVQARLPIDISVL